MRVYSLGVQNTRGYYHWKVVLACAAVMTLFLGQSLAYQFTINAHAPIFNCWKKFAFSASFLVKISAL